jgi:hypothetical protein
MDCLSNYLSLTPSKSMTREGLITRTLRTVKVSSFTSARKYERIEKVPVQFQSRQARIIFMKISGSLFGSLVLCDSSL